MLGLAQYGFATCDLGSRVDQFLRVEGASAVLTLVSPGLGIVAVGTGALDVAVWQEAVGFEVEVLFARPLVYVPVPEKLHEDVVGDLGVVLGTGGGVEVPVDAEAVPVAHELRVVAVDDVGGGDTLGVGTHGYGSSVYV